MTEQKTEIARLQAEADTHREVAESMTKMWHAERERADRLEGMCDGLAEKIVNIQDAAAAQREAFLMSPDLDPAWIAGWHAATDHIAHVLRRSSSTPAPTLCGCGHDWERHGPEAGGGIECRCALVTPDEGGE